MKADSSNGGAQWETKGDIFSKTSICLHDIKESSCLSMKWGLTYGEPSITTDEYYGGITEHWFLDCELDPEDVCHIRYFANQNKCIGVSDLSTNSDQIELKLVDCQFGDSFES